MGKQNMGTVGIEYKVIRDEELLKVQLVWGAALERDKEDSFVSWN